MYKKNLTFLALVLLAVFVPVAANAAVLNMNASTTTSLQTTTTLATTDALAATTVTVPRNAKALWVYADITLGNSTNVVLTPAGAGGGNPDSNEYYPYEAKALTLTKTGACRWLVEDFPGVRYVGVMYRCTGTATENGVTLSYKWEYD